MIWLFPKTVKHPQIHSNRVFQYKPSILEYPIFGNSHMQQPLKTKPWESQGAGHSTLPERNSRAFFSKKNMLKPKSWDIWSLNDDFFPCQLGCSFRFNLLILKCEKISSKVKKMESKKKKHPDTIGLKSWVFVAKKSRGDFMSDKGSSHHTPWQITVEPTNHPFWKQNDLPNLRDYVPCYLQGCTSYKKRVNTS